MRLKKFPIRKLLRTPLLATLEAEIALSKAINDFIMFCAFGVKPDSPEMEEPKPLDQSPADNDTQKDQESLPPVMDTQGTEKEGEVLQFKTIQISYWQQGKEMLLEVPVLSLFNIPLLTLKEATFDMELNIAYAVVGDDDNQDDFATAPAIRKVSSSSSDRQGSSNLKIHLVLNEADMPSGLHQLYGVMNSSMAYKPVSTNSTPLNTENNE